MLVLVMCSTLPISAPEARSSTVSLQWRHAICGITLIILAVGMILFEVFIRTPMYIGIWFGWCLIPAFIALTLGFLKARTLSIVNLATNSSCLLLGITVVNYLTRLKSIPPFLFINTCIYLYVLIIHTSLLIHELQWCHCPVNDDDESRQNSQAKQRASHNPVSNNAVAVENPRGHTTSPPAYNIPCPDV